MSSALPTNPPKTSSQIPPSSLSFLPQKENEFTAVHTSTPATDKQPSPPKFDASVVATAETIKGPTVPPPPPPPPPPPIVITEETSRSEVNTSIVSTSSGGDVRSSLMAAIREAGGSNNARLKSAKDRKYEAKKKKQEEQEKNVSNDSQKGGDMMADLKNTLAMRRRVRSTRITFLTFKEFKQKTLSLTHEHKHICCLSLGNFWYSRRSEKTPEWSW